jgi:hypothetical protein
VTMLAKLPESSDGRIRSYSFRYHSTMVSHAHISQV